MATAKSVDWDLWSEMPKACLWEVIAVSLNIAPPFSPKGLDLGDKLKDYEARYRLARACLDGELTIIGWPLGKEKKDPGYAIVSLTEFAAFAKRKGWKLPPRFPTVAANAAEKPTTAGDARTLGKRERETLLTIIAILVGEERLKHTTTEAKSIEAKLVRMGVDEPKERTISEHLNQAKLVLEGRKR